MIWYFNWCCETGSQWMNRLLLQIPVGWEVVGTLVSPIFLFLKWASTVDIILWPIHVETFRLKHYVSEFCTNTLWSIGVMRLLIYVSPSCPPWLSPCVYPPLSPQKLVHYYDYTRRYIHVHAMYVWTYIKCTQVSNKGPKLKFNLNMEV